MRLFVAICLSGEMKDALVRTQKELYACGVRGRFTPEENLHLTLAFIGEVPDAQPALDALSGLSFEPFELSLQGMGCFGDLWWAGLKGSASLESLARKVRRALAEWEIPYDRKRFSPHVTLIRKASGKMPGLQLRETSMTVSGISLMRSDRGKQGMIYTELGWVGAATE